MANPTPKPTGILLNSKGNENRLELNKERVFNVPNEEQVYMSNKKPTIFDEYVPRKPNYYPWAQEFINAAHDGFWTHREFSFSSDIQNFKVDLNDKEREVIVKSLSAIAQLELPIKKWWVKLGENLPHPSLIDLGITLGHQETIHSESYGHLLDILGLTEIFEDNLKLDIISGRVNYLKKYTHKFHSDNKKQFVYSLILFTLFIENVSLFSQFYTINWLHRFKRVLKDTDKQTEYSAREEQLHAMVGIKLIQTIKEEFPELFDDELKTRILHETEMAVKYESLIIDWILGDFNEGSLSPEVLKNFIKNRLNDSLDQIGYNKIFDIDSNLLEKTKWFDEQIFGNNSTDFFHSRPVEYSKKSKNFDNLF